MPVRVVSTGLPMYRVEDSGTPLTEGLARASETLLSLGPRLAELNMQRDRMQREQALQERNFQFEQGQAAQAQRNRDREEGRLERKDAWEQQNAQRQDVRLRQQAGAENRLKQQALWDKKPLLEASAEKKQAEAEKIGGGGFLNLVGKKLGLGVSPLEQSKIDLNKARTEALQQRELDDYDKYVTAVSANFGQPMPIDAWRKLRSSATPAQQPQGASWDAMYTPFKRQPTQ